MASHGLKNIAFAFGVLLIGAASQAQPMPPKLPTRPAPVSGKVGSGDPAAVALRPAAATPVVATSTARQVPPPANLNEPLLKPEAEQVPAAHAATLISSNAPAVPAPAASPVKGKTHLSHTEGQKLPETTKGHKKVGKSARHAQAAHVDAAATPSSGKRRGKTKVGQLGKRTQAEVQVEGQARTPAGHAPKVTGKAYPTAHQKAHRAGVASNKAPTKAATQAAISTATSTAPKAHKKRHASAQAVLSAAPTVSTAHELKPIRQHKADKGKAVAHHKAGSKVVASAGGDSLSGKRHQGKTKVSQASSAKPITLTAPKVPKTPRAPKKPAHTTVAA